MAKIILPVEIYEEDLRRSYWAGVFDGEGTLPLCENGMNNVRALRASVSQNNWPFLKSLQTKLSAGSLVRGGNNWRINFNKPIEIQKFLRYIEPYVVLKHQEVLIALEICRVVIEHGNRGGHLDKRIELHRMKLEAALEQAAENRKTLYLEELC